MALLKDALRSKLTKDELKIVPTSFDVIGNIAMFLDFPKELKKKEKLIAETLMKSNPHIKTVAKKIQYYKGKYRTIRVKIIAGIKTKITTHKESNALAKLDIETCYFSPRLSAERLRVAKLVKQNESILVMFSGIGIYPLVIDKNSKPREIYAIELNPAAHKYAVENVRLNKINNITLIKGDVKNIVPRLKKKFSRIIMPLPKSAENYLKYALMVSKKGTVVHFYDFQPEGHFKNSLEKIKKHAKKFKILNIKKCGQSSPKMFRICVDFKVL